MTLGGPYVFKPRNDSPGPGTYDADKAIDSILPSTSIVKINDLLVPFKRLPEVTPFVYDGHLKPFGADVNDRAVWGGKYKSPVDETPPPGYYDPEHNLVKPRSTMASINKETMVVFDGSYMTREETSYDKHCDHVHDTFGIRLVKTQMMEGAPYT